MVHMMVRGGRNTGWLGQSSKLSVLLLNTYIYMYLYIHIFLYDLDHLQGAGVTQTL